MRQGTKSVSRAGRLMQVKDTVTALGRSVTLYELAKLLHLEPSTFLRDIVHELVQSGDLVFIVVPHRKNANKRLYMLASQYNAQRQQAVLF